MTSRPFPHVPRDVTDASAEGPQIIAGSHQLCALYNSQQILQLTAVAQLLARQLARELTHAPQHPQ